MIAQTTAETLLLPTFVTALLLFATVPLGLVVGYFAFRGLRRGRRRTARALALGLVVLTAVDALLGATVTVGGTTLLAQRGPLLRIAAKCTGLLLVLYAIYGADASGAEGESG
ncbi:DUF7521 family protein [Haloglomus litoreum]|uniref:DUF7521 family protein n=1 Tax=Haloglomus litoreum TaxID=3034026 RepID=UPI0023E83617|nr:hypothetical protein [Haloglomus sp. DT116]